MTFREISEADLPAIPGLLSEGFPSTAPGFWDNALDVLSRRSAVEGMPRYGIVLESDGALCGVMLMIAHRREEVTYCNLSSWYVRDSHRGLASFMFGHSLKAKDVTFLDCSPTPAVVPIVEQFGFEPYTGGSLLLDARAAFRTGPKVQKLTPETLASCGGADRERIEENLSYGCQGFVAHDENGVAVPILYRVSRVKRHVPVARFVYGAPTTILAHAGAIARRLLVRSIPLMLLDWPTEAAVPFGRALPAYGVRYKRGDNTPDLGDLLDTEYALFGI